MKSKMRFKLVSISLLLAIPFSFMLLSGCSSSPSDAGSDTDTTPTVASTVPATTPAGTYLGQSNIKDNPIQNKTDAVVGGVAELKSMGDYKILQLQVTKVDKSAGQGADKPADGKEYLIIHIIAKNCGTTEFTTNPYFYKVQDADGKSYDVATVTEMIKDTKFKTGKVEPQGTKEGDIIYEVPKDAAGLTLVYEDNSIISGYKIKIKLDESLDTFEPLK